MIDRLVLHDATRQQLRSFAMRPAHAALITGPNGIGKTAIAEALIHELLGLPDDTLSSYPHFKTVSADGASISIEAIRDLQKFLQLKTIGTSSLRRAVLVEHADNLTTEAQNAFLKVLEEPPADTMLILTAHSPRSLLPTILSRVQTLAINTPTEAQLQTLLTASSRDSASQRQAYFLSGGLPGLLTALLSDDAAHPLLASVSQAKELLQKTPFERLCMAEGMAKQREAAHAVTEALERIAEAGLSQAAAKQEPKRIQQWHRIRKAALEARIMLEQSGNVKLTMSNLFLHL